MIATTFIDKTIVTRILVNKLRRDISPELIKARHIMGFELPEKIAAEGSNIEAVPDIIAVCNSGILVYKIELNRSFPVYTWKLLSGYARKNNGRFYIVIPDDMKNSVEKEIITNKIDAHIILFPNPSARP